MLQKKYSKILVVNPYGIGDVLFTTPLLSNLREVYPESRICIVLGSRTKQILESNNDVDKIYVFDKGFFDKLNFLSKLRHLFSFCSLLRQERFELLIDLSNSAQYGLIEKYFLNIPQRIGFNYKKRGRYLTGTLKLRGFSEKHVVAYYLSLLELINIKPVQKQLKFPLRQDTLNAIAKYLISKGIETDSLLITIVPAGGASWSDKAGYKQWPPEKYAQLADQLISGLNAKIIIAGAEADEEICQSVKKKMKLSQAITVNSFNILEFAGLCNLSNLVICNDGGPLHVAVSQGTPTVSIFGPVDERIYGPYPPDPKHAVVTKEIKCRPCYRNFKFTECQTKDCLQLIMSDEVYAKAKSVLTRYKAGLT